MILNWLKLTKHIYIWIANFEKFYNISKVLYSYRITKWYYNKILQVSIKLIARAILKFFASL